MHLCREMGFQDGQIRGLETFDLPELFFSSRFFAGSDQAAHPQRARLQISGVNAQGSFASTYVRFATSMDCAMPLGSLPRRAQQTI
jgi:hypothetical protein